MAKRGGPPEGFGLFSYPYKVSSPLLVEYLGHDIEAPTSLSQHRALETLLDATLQRDSILKTIRQCMLDHNIYDPAGQHHWKPLRFGSRQHVVECYLGGFGDRGLVLRERVTKSHPAHASTLAVYREDYARHRRDGTAPLATLKRWTGAVMAKLYGQQSDWLASAILPVQHERDGWSLPATTITESFNQGASDTVGPDLSWTELTGDWDTTAGNTLILSTATAAFFQLRADSDLSSDDHYAQTELSNVTAITSGRPGILIRKDDGATLTFYMSYVSTNNSPDTWHSFKSISASLTQIGTQTVIDGVDDDVLKLDADGTTIERFRNGGSQNSATDSAVSGNFRCGYEGRTQNIEMDNFEASDGAAPPASATIGIIGGGLGAGTGIIGD